MTTSEVARRAGVNSQTLRYYERRGLIPKPKRRANGYRHYGADTVRRIRFIKRAQDLGFSLSEVDELLRLRTKRAPLTVRAVARQKLDDVERRIDRLRAVRRALRDLIADCEKSCSDTHCPILEALAGEGGS